MRSPSALRYTLLTAQTPQRASQFLTSPLMLGEVVGMAGRYTGSYLDRSNGWRAVATLADIGQASLVGRIPNSNMASPTAMANHHEGRSRFPFRGPDIASVPLGRTWHEPAFRSFRLGFGSWPTSRMPEGNLV
jgi:hypothetical protein